MFPPPTTIETSSPCDWTAQISDEIPSTVRRSTPNSRPPISASPESFSRTRRKASGAVCAAAAASSSRTDTASAGEREALELEHLGALLAEHLAHGPAGVVDPGLLVQDLRAEEALAEHALDDLLAGLLRLRQHLVGVRVDVALGGDDVRGHVLAAHPLRRRGGDVHRDAARQLRRAA